MLLTRLLNRITRIGRIELVDAAGRMHVFAGSPGPAVKVRLHDKALHWKLAVNPWLYLPEAYVDGTLTIEAGSVYDLVDLLVRNEELMATDMPLRLANRVRQL